MRPSIVGTMIRWLSRFIPAVWDDVPVQRCPVHEHGNLLGTPLSTRTRRSPPIPAPTGLIPSIAVEAEARIKGRSPRGFRRVARGTSCPWHVSPVRFVPTATSSPTCKAA